MQKKISIDTTSEFKVKIEKISEFETSFFSDIYVKALNNISDIIENTKEYYYSKHKDTKEDFKYKLNQEHNNIIAFAGERGAGKTSAMLSIAMALNNSKSEKVNLEYLKNLDIIEKSNFLVLDSIDPSLLEKEESIFQVVLANLFENFKETIERGGGDIAFQRDILKNFERVYNNFKTIINNKNNNSNILEDNLQDLSNLAASSNMRKNFIKLIQSILEYEHGKNNLDSSFLVLSIDDLDMNIENAAIMAEEIRKYLLIPNLIILMAIKVEQLTDSIEQKFISEYKTLLDSKKTLEDDPKNMAGRYIEKLIPNGRKIYLPNLNISDNIDEYTLIINKGENKPIEGYTDYKSLQLNLLSLIYKKTGLIFLKPKYGIHYLVPDNMRELHNMVCIFSKLPDINPYTDDANDVGKIKNNLKVFENYFYKTWIKRNLKDEYLQIIEEFKNINYEHKNKFIIEKIASLKEKLASEAEINKELKLELFKHLGNRRYSYTNFNINLDYFESLEVKRQFEQLVNSKSYCNNISLGDFIECLEINQEYDNEDIKKFKFAIKTMYSLLSFKNLFLSDNDDKNSNYELVYKLTGGNILGYEKYRDCLKNKNFKGQCTINNYNYMPIFIRITDDKAYKIPLLSIIKFLSKSNLAESDNETRIKNLVKDIVDIKNRINATEEKIRTPKCLEAYINESPIKDDDIEFLINHIETFEQQAIKNLEFIHYFIYQGCDLESKAYRYSINTYYDIDVNLGRGFLDHKSATFSILAVLTKLLNPEKILANIIDSYLKSNLEEDKFNSVKENLLSKSNFKYINDWRKKYKTIIPMYSLDILEYISENLKNIANIRLIGKYNDYLFEPSVRLIKSLQICLDNIQDINKYLNNLDIKECFNTNPIIEMLENNNNLSESIFEAIISYCSFEENDKSNKENLLKENLLKENLLKDKKENLKNLRKNVRATINRGIPKNQTVRKYLKIAAQNILSENVELSKKIIIIKRNLDKDLMMSLKDLYDLIELALKDLEIIDVHK